MTNSSARKIRVIDSHTGGEPTRLVVSGGPDLGNGPLSDPAGTIPRRTRRFPLRRGE